MTGTETAELIWPRSVEISAAVLFACAVLHTFSVKQLNRLAERFPEGSVSENLFHLLGEVEVVFGLWSTVFLGFIALQVGHKEAIQYLESRNFTEPLFVFVIMTVCATKPVLGLVSSMIDRLARLVPGHQDFAEFLLVFTIGPLLGSIITEPASMTVCALIALDRFFSRTDNLKFKYAMIGLLFVNISIGGTLTSFAAPPVLMVAHVWGWDSAFMFLHFGDKALLACVVSTLATAFVFRRSLLSLKRRQANKESTQAAPMWIIATHLVFVGLIVLMAHHPVVFVGLFMLFLGLAAVTREYQAELKVKEGLLVGFFLAGLVVLGGLQRWWLEPLIMGLGDFALFSGATVMTAFTDNAALTYLGSLVPGLSDSGKYALVAGAVTGGGLTIIANAPNPAGYGILKDAFGQSGISPIGLLLGSLPATIVAALCFWFL